MPKKHVKNGSSWNRKSGGLKSDSSKNYYEHDDRCERKDSRNHSSNSHRQSNRPRVSFKTQSHGTRIKPTKANVILKQFDDDVNMDHGTNNNNRSVIVRGRGRGFYRGRNSPLPRDHRGGGSMDRSKHKFNSDWYKVRILRSENFAKEFVIGNLLSYISPLTFTPIMYKIVGESAVFYIDNSEVAKKLRDCDGRYTYNNGLKLSLDIRPETPHIDIDNALKEKLKLVLAKRFVQETNALNLSEFHHDPDLVNDTFCPLSRWNILSTVMDIVAAHVPNLQALNLDKNKMFLLEKLGYLGSKFKKLKILHLAENKVKELAQFNNLKNLKLEELRIIGNPLCERYDGKQDQYIRDFRDRFPNLLKLDEITLPPPIKFDLADDKLKIRPTKKIFFSDETAKEHASQFLHQYFLIFDSDNRQPLLDAYHEQASFSLTIPPAPNNRFFGYHKENRNLLKLDRTRRADLLHRGKLQVVAFISQLPKTKHDLSSCTMDLIRCPFQEGMMLITVTGLFKEKNSSKDKKDLIRYFNRTFIITPVGAGYCIINEQLHISEPTSAQEKEFNTPVNDPVPQNVTPVTISEDMKKEMTLALSQVTNMNIEWSLRCLEEVQWNYDTARIAFQEAFALGKIPQEAFQK